MEKSSKFKRFLTRIGNVRLGHIWEKLRKPFNFCWKTGLAIFAIVFVIQLDEALIDTCKDHLGILDEGVAIAFVYKKVKDKITPEINLKVDETIEDWFGT